MSVLRRAYVEVEPDVSGFDAKLRDKFARADPGGKAGKQLGGQLNRALKRLDLDPVDVRADPSGALRAIDETEAKLAALSRNASTVEIKIRAEQGLREISRFRKTLGDVGEDAGPEAAVGFFARFSGRLGPLMASMPINGPVGIAMAAAGAVAAPVFISAFASALAAGAGAGVIGAGLAAAAKDPGVAARGTEVGQRFKNSVQREAREAFAGPLLQSLDRLDAAGQRTATSLGRAFDRLAPELDPLVGKVIRAGEVLVGSLLAAAERSGPALDGLGDSVLLLGQGIGDFIGIVADGGPEAADNLRLLAGVTADLVRQTGFMLHLFNEASSNTWLTGPLLPLLRKHYAETADETQNLITKTTAADGSMRRLSGGSFGAAQGLEAAKGAAQETTTAVNPLYKAQEALAAKLQVADAAARGEASALKGLSDQLRSQTDPAFALITAQNTLKQAHDKAAEATRKHGRNSGEARAATRELATAALDLQGKAGSLASGFNGRLTPSMRATFEAAGLTERQINDVERQLTAAKKAADKYAGKYKAEVSATGVPAVAGKLNALSELQSALKRGTNPPARLRRYFGEYAEGGHTGPGHKHQVAGVVHADEFVVRKSARRQIEQRHPGLLDEMNATGQLPPGYAIGGLVQWPFPVTAAKARVPSAREAMDAVTPSFGDWPSSPAAQRGDSGVWRRIVGLIRGTGPMSGAFGNGYRPGDPKWHGSGRAVDWMGFNQDGLAGFLAAKRPLELIHRTRNRDYAYTRGRNVGSFNNALMEAHRNHIHIAMANGGVIEEPVAGVGLRSGNSYSFGERGPETVTPGVGAGEVHFHFHGPVASKQAAQDMVLGAYNQLRREKKVP